MKIESIRFGTLEIDERQLITFPSGLIGFPKEHGFILLGHGKSNVIGWLQSTTTPAFALPVVSAHGLPESYPDVPVMPHAARAGLGRNVKDLALLVVLSAASGQPSTVNLLAPIVIDAETRTGAQIVLEGSRFSTRELFVMPDEKTESTAPAQVAEAR